MVAVVSFVWVNAFSALDLTFPIDSLSGKNPAIVYTDSSSVRWRVGTGGSWTPSFQPKEGYNLISWTDSTHTPFSAESLWVVKFCKSKESGFCKELRIYSLASDTNYTNQKTTKVVWGYPNGLQPFDTTQDLSLGTNLVKRCLPTLTDSACTPTYTVILDTSKPVVTQFYQNKDSLFLIDSIEITGSIPIGFVDVKQKTSTSLNWHVSSGKTPNKWIAKPDSSQATLRLPFATNDTVTIEDAAQNRLRFTNLHLPTFNTASIQVDRIKDALTIKNLGILANGFDLDSVLVIYNINDITNSNLFSYGDSLSKKITLSYSTFSSANSTISIPFAASDTNISFQIQARNRLGLWNKCVVITKQLAIEPVPPTPSKPKHPSTNIQIDTSTFLSISKDLTHFKFALSRLDTGYSLLLKWTFSPLKINSQNSAIISDSLQIKDIATNQFSIQSAEAGKLVLRLTDRDSLLIDTSYLINPIGLKNLPSSVVEPKRWHLVGLSDYQIQKSTEGHSQFAVYDWYSTNWRRLSSFTSDSNHLRAVAIGFESDTATLPAYSKQAALLPDSVLFQKDFSLWVPPATFQLDSNRTDLYFLNLTGTPGSWKKTSQAIFGKSLMVFSSSTKKYSLTELLAPTVAAKILAKTSKELASKPQIVSPGFLSITEAVSGLELTTHPVQVPWIAPPSKSDNFYWDLDGKKWLTLSPYQLDAPSSPAHAKKVTSKNFYNSNNSIVLDLLSSRKVHFEINTPEGALPALYNSDNQNILGKTIELPAGTHHFTFAPIAYPVNQPWVKWTSSAKNLRLEWAGNLLGDDAPKIVQVQLLSLNGQVMLSQPWNIQKPLTIKTDKAFKINILRITAEQKTQTVKISSIP